MLPIYDCGRRLKSLREEKRLTQTQVAKRLCLTRSSISGYESNLSQPSIDTLVRLAQLYHTTTDYLLGVTRYPVIVLDGLTEPQQTMLKQLANQFIQTCQILNRQRK